MASDRQGHMQIETLPIFTSDYNQHRTKMKKMMIKEKLPWWAYMTAPQGAVPAKMASSPTAKMTINHTKPALLAGGIQKAATIARKPTTALMPALVSQSGCSFSSVSGYLAISDSWMAPHPI